MPFLLQRERERERERITENRGMKSLEIWAGPIFETVSLYDGLNVWKAQVIIMRIWQ